MLIWHFIPIDFTKLIYIGPHHNYCDVPPNCPPTPPTNGVKEKDTSIKYFWDMFVDPYLNCTKKTKHFMFYSFVLWDICFDYIPNEIEIFAYEDEISLSASTYFTNSYYIKNNSNSLSINNNSELNQNVVLEYQTKQKTHNLGFFGSMDRTNYLKNRSFLNHISTPIIRDTGSNATKYLPHLKYVFVLRGIHLLDCVFIKVLHMV